MTIQRGHVIFYYFYYDYSYIKIYYSHNIIIIILGVLPQFLSSKLETQTTTTSEYNVTYASSPSGNSQANDYVDMESGKQQQQQPDAYAVASSYTPYSNPYSK